METFVGLFSRVRARTPLVHFLTNYVTVNDCANMTLACGGSPIMADQASEVEQMVALCSALVINIGTANERILASMLLAGRRANELGIPVVLDPVGAGASDFRNDAVRELLREVNFSIIKGNISEISFLAGGMASTRGVDAARTHLVREETLGAAAVFSRKLSVITGSIIVITGPIDIVADSEAVWAVRNGHPMMSRVTGTGCMTAGVAGCFLGVNPEDPAGAAVAATAAMGLCGELAYARLTSAGGGTGAYRTLLIDAMSLLDDALLGERMRVERLAL